MTEQEFLEHHHLTRNPFADEDAQTDAVFKDFCIESIFHPAWSKAYGDPSEPATAIVLGPKGSGKTAMRLQMAQHLRQYNLSKSDRRVFFIHYDDFNAYLGPLQQSLPARVRENPDKVLKSVQLWDHIDAILCQSTTQLVDKILTPRPTATDDDGLQVDPKRVAVLDRAQKRDLLLWQRFRPVADGYIRFAMDSASSRPSVSFAVDVELSRHWDRCDAPGRPANLLAGVDERDECADEYLDRVGIAGHRLVALRMPLRAACLVGLSSHRQCPGKPTRPLHTFESADAVPSRRVGGTTGADGPSK